MLEIRSLGGLSVALNGAPLAGLASRKATALLIYLAYTRVPHAREVLAEFLWEEQSQDQALGNLRVALASLKAQIGPYLEITRQTLAWNLDSPTYFDAVELSCQEGEVQRAREHDRSLRDEERLALDRVLADYRGDFLHGFYLKDSVAFEEWASLERERLRRFAGDALCSLADDALGRGQYRRAASRASQLLLIDPTNEECHRKAMLALALAGDRSAAMAQFERFRRVLAEELDVEPEEETIALYGRIRDGRLAPRLEAGPGENYLRSLAAPDQNNRVPPVAKPRESSTSTPPRPLTSFIGREADVAGLSRLLASSPGSPPPGSNPRLITLCGPGGCGKTRLALEVAAETTGLFPDGCSLLDLAAVPEPSLLAAALAEALGIQEQPAVPLIDTLSAVLESRHQLIILDGCEHLAEAAGALALAILNAAPRVRIIATSQVVLGVIGERRWQVSPLPAPQAPARRQLSPADAAKSPAVQLFVDRVRAVNRDFVLSDAAVPAVVRICRQLDGMPLALELAAAQVKLLSPQQIADRLDDMFRLLHSGAAASRHNSLLAAIVWSCSLLSPNERILLRRLGVFRGEFTLEAAEFVCSGDGLEVREVLHLLGSLVDKSFVVSSGQEAVEPSRYRILEVVRQHVAEWLEVAGEAVDVRGRHLVFYSSAAEVMEDRLRGPDQAWARGQIERDYDNYRAALSWGLSSASSCLQDALRLVAALSEFWQRTDRFDVGRTWSERALSAIDHAPSALQARVYSAAGTFAWLQGNYAEAAAHHDSGLKHARAAGDRAAIAFALNNLGVVACYEDRLAEAAAQFAEALGIYEELGDTRGRATVLTNLNLLKGIRGDFAMAREYGEKALPLWRKLGDDYHLATVLHNLGDLARIQGDLDRAKVFLEESITLCRKQNNGRMMMMCRTALGRMMLKQGKLAEAAECFRVGLVLSRNLGERRWFAEQLEGLGEVAIAGQRWPRGARLFGGAMTLLAAMRATLWLPDLPEHVGAVEAAREALGHSQFEAEWAAGSSMTLDRIFDLAMAEG